eukprot:RCo035502
MGGACCSCCWSDPLPSSSPTCVLPVAALNASLNSARYPVPFESPPLTSARQKPVLAGWQQMFSSTSGVPNGWMPQFPCPSPPCPSRALLSGTPPRTLCLGGALFSELDLSAPRLIEKSLSPAISIMPRPSFTKEAVPSALRIPTLAAYAFGPPARPSDSSSAALPSLPVAAPVSNPSSRSEYLPCDLQAGPRLSHSELPIHCWETGVTALEALCHVYVPQPTVNKPCSHLAGTSPQWKGTWLITGPPGIGKTSYALALSLGLPQFGGLRGIRAQGLALGGGFPAIFVSLADVSHLFT